MTRVLLTLSLLCLTIFSINAQQTDENFELKSPYSTVYTHLYNLQPETYNPEVSKTAFGDKGTEKMAIQLKQILDGKGLYVEMLKLPVDSSHIDTLTGVQSFQMFPNELPDITIRRYGSKWYYSKRTIAAIPKIHKKLYPFGANLIVDLFPKFGQNNFLGFKIWQWIGMVFLLVICGVIYKLIHIIIRPILRRILKTRFKEVIPDENLIWRITRSLSIILVLELLIRVSPILQLSIDMSKGLIRGVEIVQTLFFIFLLLRVVDLMIHYFKILTEKTESTLDNQVIPIIRTTLDVIVVIGGIIHILTLLEVNVTALIAGLSIGGLALALAAQDTVKNLIGSIMIFADKPFQIGQLIKVKDIVGTVEVVGFRSTQIRTTDNSLVSVPNGILANEVINNLGLRIYRKFAMTLGVTYQTTPEQIEQFVNGIREIIQLHPQTKKDGFEVHLNELGNSSVNILFNGFLDVPGWTAELKAKQEILIAIIQLAQLLNISFAFPSTSVYIEKEAVKTDKTYASVDTLLEAFKNQFEEQSEENKNE